MADKLQMLFPEGYSVAVPERSVGMAISEDATADLRASFVELVRNCQRDGTTPMLSRLLNPSDVAPRTR